MGAFLSESSRRTYLEEQKENDAKKKETKWSYKLDVQYI